MIAQIPSSRLTSEVHTEDSSDGKSEANPSNQKRPLDCLQLAVLECPSERTGIANLKAMLAVLETLHTTVMKRGIDYDTILGTPKPTLLKPGAELLVRFFSLVPDTRIVKRMEKIEIDIPYFQYDAECRLCNKYEIYLGNGIGSCNSGEPAYAFRWVFESELPEELREKKDELRANTLNGQTLYKIGSSRNDIFGAVNAIQKRAKKRAFVDAVLGVIGADRVFTQDMKVEEGENSNDGT